MVRPFQYSGMYCTINNYRKLTFQWGLYDCCMFVADVLHAATGDDYGGPFRGKYDTKKGAMACLKPYGGIDGYLDSCMTPVDTKFMRRGAVVKIEGNGVFSVGINDGRHLVFMDKKGVQTLPLDKAERAWHVPNIA